MTSCSLQNVPVRSGLVLEKASQRDKYNSTLPPPARIVITRKTRDVPSLKALPVWTGAAMAESKRQLHDFPAILPRGSLNSHLLGS